MLSQQGFGSLKEGALQEESRCHPADLRRDSVDTECICPINHECRSVEASAISGWDMGGKNEEPALDGTSAVFVSGPLHKSPRFAPGKSFVAWSIILSIILV
jgi:hypothetical protein